MFRRSGALALVPRPVEAVPPPPPAFIRPAWFASPGSDWASKIVQQHRHIIKAFLERRFGSNRVRVPVSCGSHVFYTGANGNELWIHKDNPSLNVKICIAKLVKVGGIYVGNASSLEGQKQPKKIHWLDGRQMRIQVAMAECMPMVPFRMFEENGLDLDTFVLQDRGPEEMLDIKNARRQRDRRPQHFTGAMVFSLVKKAGGAEYFLFDVDRNELALENFNAFLSKLPGVANSIAQAYDMLKPAEVKAWEAEHGKVAIRQGEWFFLPVKERYTPRRDVRSPLKHAEGVLRSKGHRAHLTSKIDDEGKGFVAGQVWHEGREHVEIELEKGVWYRPVSNEATVSFRVTGGVD